VTGIHCDLQATARADVDQPMEERRVILQNILVINSARSAGVLRDSVDKQILNLSKPCLLPDRAGERTAHLDAVVFSWVVAGSEHRARAFLYSGGEIQLVRRGQAEQGDVEPLCSRAVGETSRQLR